MKTSQSAYGNTDGSTTFYNWTSNPAPLTCADMVANSIHTRDGTYGRKLFYEARGFTVTDCYSQKTDNNGGGFTFANYKAQIDAGFPVLLNVTGHTMVGIGYLDPSTVYINDTWDHQTHQMPWGGSYSGMTMQSVSIVNPRISVSAPTITSLSPTSAAAGGAAFTLTVNGTNFVAGSVVHWNGANRTTTYVSGTRLTAGITAADIATAGSYPVTVVNPGGGTSNAVPFTVVPTSADIDVTPASLSVTLAPGQTATRVLTIRNTGTGGAELPDQRCGDKPGRWRAASVFAEAALPETANNLKAGAAGSGASPATAQGYHYPGAIQSPSILVYTDDYYQSSGIDLCGAGVAEAGLSVHCLLRELLWLLALR